MQLSDLKKRMKGVMVVQATPFNADGSLDLGRTVDPEDAVVLCGIGELMFSCEVLYGYQFMQEVLKNHGPHTGILGAGGANAGHMGCEIENLLRSGEINARGGEAWA